MIVKAVSWVSSFEDCPVALFAMGYGVSIFMAIVLKTLAAVFSKEMLSKDDLS